MDREFKLNKEKLNEKYLRTYEDIFYRISSEFYDDDKLYEIKKDVLGMFIESQERGIDVKEVVGEDLEEFCLEILNDNKSNPIIFALELTFLSISIISLLFIISNGLDWLSPGFQYLYYDSIKQVSIVHYITDKSTFMLEKYLISEIAILILIIISVNFLVCKNIFKFKKRKNFMRIISLITYCITYISSRILKSTVNSLDDYIEVKIIYIEVIFILSVLIYFLLKKYKKIYFYKILK